MATKYIISKSKMTAIADAVRKKTGKTATMTADQIASAIAGISSRSDITITDADYLFKDGARFDDYDKYKKMLKPWSANHMFDACTDLTSFSFTDFDAAELDKMDYMLAGTSLTSLTFDGLTSAPRYASHMLDGSELSSIDFSALDTDSLTIADYMLSGTKITTLDLSHISFGFLQSAEGFLSGCTSLTSFSASSSTFSYLSDVSKFFSGCTSLQTVDTGIFNTDIITTADQIYANSGITDLTLADKAFPALTSANSPFDNCSAIKNVTITGCSFPKLTAVVLGSSMSAATGSKLTIKDCTATSATTFTIFLNLDEIYIDSVTIGSSPSNVGVYGDSIKKLTIKRSPTLLKAAQGMYKYSNRKNLTYVDLRGTAKTISDEEFSETNLTTLVISGDSVVSLDSTYALNSTPISKGNGYIYVPRSQLSTYKTATNWVQLANQIRAIEDYTVDGTLYGDMIAGA